MVLLTLGIILERLINKLLGVERVKLSDTPGKNVDRWGRVILVFIFISTSWLVIDEDTIFLKGFWMLYIILIFGFQVIMELVYVRNSKQYISTLIFMFIGIIAIYHLEFFIQLFE